MTRWGFQNQQAEMGKKIQTHRDLDVYQKAFDTAMQIHETRTGAETLSKL
jgi:hypothetical protein